MTSPRLVSITLPDSPSAWVDAGFLVEGSTVRVGALDLVCADDPGAEPVLGFDRPHPHGTASLDGIVWDVTPTGRHAEPASHPNGIDGVDHLVIMAPDLDRARTALVEAGFEIRRERPTTIGSTAVTQLFARAGDRSGTILEVVAPTGPGGPGPSRLWGLALLATDLDATTDALGDHASGPRDAVQPGRRIATVRHENLGMAFTLAVMDHPPG